MTERDEKAFSALNVRSGLSHYRVTDKFFPFAHAKLGSLFSHVFVDNRTSA